MEHVGFEIKFLESDEKMGTSKLPTAAGKDVYNPKPNEVEDTCWTKKRENRFFVFSRNRETK